MSPTDSDLRARTRALEAAMLLDTQSEPVFDRVTALAARATSAPVALVSFVGARRPFVKSAFGLIEPWASERRTPLRAEIVAHGRPLVVADVRDHPLLGDSAVAAALDLVAYAAVPLRFDGAVLGSLCVIDREAHPWAAADLALLVELGLVVEEIIALRRRALEQAELSRRLQRGLLPQATTHVDFAVETAYEPGSERLLLGGDFADVHHNDDGALDFVIGDVSGHGPEAAALAVAMRGGWHALRDRDVPLDELMATLNRIVWRERHDVDLFATAMVGRIASGAGSIAVVAAGHPPPVVLGDTPRELAVTHGLVLGARTDVTWAVSTADLAGASVLVYTDGLIEGRAARGSSGRFGVERLLEAIAAHRRNGDGAPIAAALIATATAAHGAPLADDVAALVIRPRRAAG